MLMDANVSLAFLLHDLGRQFRHEFDLKARVLGVTRPQWRTLLAIARNEGVTQSEVADIIEVERITLCRMVDRLSEAGLVERRADPLDRRVWRLHLMPKAKEIVAQLSAIGAGIEAQALSDLSAAEQTMLREMLTRVRTALQPGERDARGKRASTGGAA